MDGWLSDITAAINRLVQKWTGSDFSSLAETVASQFVRASDQINQRKFQQQMRSIGVDVFGSSPAIEEMLEGAVYDNVKLIKSIPEQYLYRVENIILTNMRAGLTPTLIIGELQEQFGVTQRRAKMIARDQTSKVNGDLNKKRQIEAGFQYFEWVDSSDNRVRERHEDIANKVTAYGKGIYRWDNPPLGSDGKPILPGSDYNCFPSDSKLNNTSFADLFYRRRYRGELTEIISDDGV